MWQTRILILLVVVSESVSLRAGIAIPEWVKFPSVPSTMPVYSLSRDDGLSARAAAALGVFPSGPADEAAYFLPVTGVPQPLEDETVAKESAKIFFEKVVGVPAAGDVTQNEMGPRFVVARQTALRDGTLGKVQVDSSWFRLNRLVGTRRIYGPGSGATLEMRGKNIVSTVIRWDKVQKAAQDRIVLVPDRETLRRWLEKEFPDARFQIIEVLQSPELVYYDDRQTLAPAFRIVLSVNDRDGAPPDRAERFMPAVTGPANPPLPANALAVDCPTPASTSRAGMDLDRYVLKEDAQWMRNGYFFVQRLVLQQGAFVLRHFCYIEDTMLSSQKAGFLDSAHIALVETHGLPAEIKVKIHGQDYEYVRIDGFGGFGAALRLLILHSCDVIRTADDDATGWDDPWFKVFAGLHTVLGYRTTIEMDDNVSIAYASRLQADDPMIRSWFSEASLSSKYSNRPPASTSSTKKLGSAAAVTVCGQEQAKRSQLAAMATPNCLESFWFKD